jgi:hypothetical protein
MLRTEYCNFRGDTDVRQSCMTSPCCNPPMQVWNLRREPLSVQGRDVVHIKSDAHFRQINDCGIREALSRRVERKS